MKVTRCTEYEYSYDEFVKEIEPATEEGIGLSLDYDHEPCFDIHGAMCGFEKNYAIWKKIYDYFKGKFKNADSISIDVHNCDVVVLVRE